MKLTALSLALIAALGAMSGCSTQNTMSQASRPAAQYALGRYYQGQQRYELAIEAYRRALAADPAHVGAHNGLGASLLLAGRTAEAIEQFKTGLQHQPRSAALWNNLGYAYALSGENTLAEMAYKQSLDLDPTDYKTHTNLAAVQQAAPEAAPVAAAQQPQVQAQAAQPAAVETRVVKVYPAPERDAETAPPLSARADETPAPAATFAASDIVAAQNAAAQAKAAIPVKVSETAPPAAPSAATSAPVAVSAAIPASVPARAILSEPAAKPQPAVEAAKAPAVPPSVQLAEVAPRVFEVKLPETGAAAVAGTQLASVSAPVAGATRISVPLREDVMQTAAVDAGSFMLEIRNGNGAHRMAFRTSQYLAGHGYTTHYLTNQPGFDVKLTQVLYLPGYLEEAKRLLAYLPKDAVLKETDKLRPGIQIRVVLGQDMTLPQPEKEPTRTASAASDDFVLEIRNGNGVRRMALHTSQYLAAHGYTTERLTNQRGFNVKVTQVLYLPGYLEEARKLLAHLPKDAVLKETDKLRPGTHVRVVLGKDMA